MYGEERREKSGVRSESGGWRVRSRAGEGGLGVGV